MTELREVLEFEPEETVQLVLEQDIAGLHHTHFDQFEARDCQGVGCPDCAKGIRRSKRWHMPVKVGPFPYVWSMSKTNWRRLKELYREQGGLTGVVVNVTRHGDKLDTTYVIEFVERGEVAAAPTEEPPKAMTGTDVEGLKLYIGNICESLELDPQEVTIGVAKALAERGISPTPEELLRAVVRDVDARATQASRAPEMSPEEMAKLMWGGGE